MPLPFILAGAAVAAGVTGLAKGVRAIIDNSEANDTNRAARSLIDRTQAELNEKRQAASQQLEELGAMKLEAWDKDMQRFVTTFRRLKNVELTDGLVVDDLARNFISEGELARVTEASFTAGSLLAGSAGAVGSGVLIGMASYGGVGLLGTASTGAAISGLGGVAATNATLAWLGGGSLAAGGYGMAGGALVLGGLVAGPALLVGGLIFSATAKAKLAKAYSNFAEAGLVAEQMKIATTAVEAIHELATDFTEVIAAFQARFRDVLTGLETLIKYVGEDYHRYDDKQKELVWLTVESAAIMRTLLDTPLLNEDGSIRLEAKQAKTLPASIELKLNKA